jgi:peptidoglycan-associated lipoprotein
MRKSLVGIIALALSAGGTTACATKGFVSTEVGRVNGKTDSLTKSLEQTQERVRQNETKIASVDGKAQQAQSAADQAKLAAGAADARAAAAGDTAKLAADRADMVDKATKRLVYTVVLNEGQSGFTFNKVSLPPEAQSRIDQLVAGIKADPKGAYFEIEGHTDNIGSKDVNDRIGLERAKAVERYLYEHHSIPLHRMSVISYGQDKPAAPNTTKEGRAQNRRIVIKVLI